MQVASRHVEADDAAPFALKGGIERKVMGKGLAPAHRARRHGRPRPPSFRRREKEKNTLVTK